ncbi:hypothetical protein [Ornithinimicrobium faecis]|uniref:hypothetical protein n=1 Tax=Ornithinimicrobium faecis TaxID=2934158 RepID=UPI0021183FEC|nr:hypothetical protein [Ornithinimicrobium sp. HY1745]
MSQSTSLRISLVTLASALILSACTGSEAREASAPQDADSTHTAAPEPSTEADLTEPALSSDEILDTMGAAWDTTAPDRRVAVCEDVVMNSDQETMNVTSILLGVETSDLKDSEGVILGFWEEQCAEQAQVETVVEDIDVDVEIEGSVDEAGSDAWWADTAVMGWWGGLSEADEASICEMADVHGVDGTASALANSMNEALADAETTVDTATFARWISKECGLDFEENKDSEDWVRDSADAWFTEAAVHSIWTSSNEGDVQSLCDASETLSIEYMARTFATDVLEPVWADNSPAIDIGAVEDTLTELCA